MRPNSLKAKLRAGQRVVGALITINDPELVETFGHLGYDFVFIDGQHGGLTVETARELIRAAELTGMTSWSVCGRTTRRRSSSTSTRARAASSSPT